MRKFLAFLSEPGGKTSFARVIATFLVLVYVIWGSYIVVVERRICDVPFYLFLLIVSLYGLNKVVSCLNSKKEVNYEKFEREDKGDDREKE